MRSRSSRITLDVNGKWLIGRVSFILYLGLYLIATLLNGIISAFFFELPALMDTVILCPCCVCHE